MTSWSGRWTQTKYTKLQLWRTFSLNKTPGKGTRWIYLYRSKGWRPRRWEDVLRQPKLTIGRTRLMGPSGGDATPLDLLFDSDSAAASDCESWAQVANLKVNLIRLERARNLVSNKKRITQFGVRMKKLLAF